MASTVSDGDGAADRYRRAQRGLSRLLRRDVGRLWRLLNPARPASFTDWLDAMEEVVTQFGDTSARLAAEFYDEQRVAAEVNESFTVPMADPPQREQTETVLRWATHDVWETEPETERQRDPLDVRLDTAERQMEAATQKLVADQGRETIRQAAREDRHAVGYARAAALGACAFCALMASRGMVYKSAGTAGQDANERFSGDASVAKFHDNCVPAETLVDGPAAEVGYRRWYEGEMLIIGTAAGHKLSITPNHPVLTDRGWVPAGLIRPGDCVLSSFNAQGSLLSVPDEQHVPARIEDVWSALSVLGLVGMPVTSEDFHGDGTHGKVDVVRADGLLGRYLNVTDVEVFGERELAWAGVGESVLALRGSSERHFGRDFTTPDRIVGSFGEMVTFLRGQFGEPVEHGFAAPSDGYGAFGEYAANRGSRRAVALSQREFTLSRRVRGGYVELGEFDLPCASSDASSLQFAGEDACGHSATVPDFSSCFPFEVERNSSVEVGWKGSVGAGRFDPSGLYGSVDGRRAYARLGRDLGERLAGRVESDRVIELRRINFAGHVYNLQTAQGWYRADGVIVSNCHCGIIPVFKGQRFELSAHAREWDRLYREYAAPFPGDQLRRFRRAIAEHDSNPLPGSF